MEDFISTIGVFCVLIFIIGLLYECGCFATTEKTIRFVVAICMVSITVKSFYNIDFTNISTSDYINTLHYDNYEILKKEIINTAKNNIETEIKRRLDEKNISYNYLELHILEENEDVKIDTINIVCSDEYSNDIYACLKDIISDSTKIIIGD